MKNFFRKAGKFLALSLFIFTLLSQHLYAYVRVSGYTKANGTYVAPYVRSNPNGLKYDNYGYKPSQGLYNSTYGMRGNTWDTPTYITDPTYYQGQSIYNSLQNIPSYSSSYSTPTSTSSLYNYSYTTQSLPSTYQENPTTINIAVPVNGILTPKGDDWNCKLGFKKNFSNKSCDSIVAPANATVNIGANNGWICNYGYQISSSNLLCEKIIVPQNATLEKNTWKCNSGFIKNSTQNSCVQIVIPKNAHLNIYIDSWDCNKGFRRDYGLNECIEVIIPKNAVINTLGTSWDCAGGYKKNINNTECISL